MAASALEQVLVGDEEDYHFFYNPFKKAILVNDTDYPTNSLKFFFTRPFYAPLLFPNMTSDARDHAANERTYLSYLRLAVYLAVVAVAILINFHLKHQPTPLEQRISHPLGFIFWILALACLAAGFANYIRTITKYARRAALVQSGLKTQIVFGVVSVAIIAACTIFLAAEAQRTDLDATNSKLSESAARSLEAGRNGQTMQDQILMILGNAAGQGFLQVDSDGIV